ncbi:MAG: ribonuclease III [Halocynthiibacter sp.]
MKISADLKAFCDRIGYGFKDPSLLSQAVTHSSMSSPTREDNQRLEFLGDRVLGLVMANALFDEDQKAAEGILAPRFNALVRKETCADVAREIDLGAVLKLGRSEMKTGGRRKDALLGDGMEAVIAAVYLDGGFGAAKNMILTLWGNRVTQVEADARDAKTSLQEWAQARKMRPPIYDIMERSGPDHAPVFTIKVSLQTGENKIAKAGSKRNAEQMAAKALLAELEN